jgi:hypothetical protein
MPHCRWRGGTAATTAATQLILALAANDAAQIATLMLDDVDDVDLGDRRLTWRNLGQR